MKIKKDKRNKTVSIAFRLTVDDGKKLKALAERKMLRTSELVRNEIKRLIKEIEE